MSLIVYLCLAPTGLFTADAPMAKSWPGFPWPPGDVWDPASAIEAMYPRLDPELAASAAAKLRPGTPPLDDYPIERHPDDTPAAAVYAAYDEFFPPDWQRWAAREVLGVEPVEIQTGHFPMLEAPHTLAGILEMLAPCS